VTCGCDYGLHHVNRRLVEDAAWRKVAEGSATAGRSVAPDDRPIVAVMDVEDRSSDLSDKTLATLTDYLRVLLAGSGRYVVVDKGRQQEARDKIVKNLRAESYKKCYDRTCQIPLGQALAADSLLATSIVRLGNTYIIRAELIDLAKAASVAGAVAKCEVQPKIELEDCLAAALEQLISQLTDCAQSPDR